MKLVKDLCPVCEGPKQGHWLYTKTVCLRCDELLFDIEIEGAEDEVQETEQGASDKLLEPLKKAA